MPLRTILLNWLVQLQYQKSVSNPPRSKVKGRKKEKRLKKGMNAESKRQNKCGICRLTGHNAAKCSSKKEIEDGKLGS